MILHKADCNGAKAHRGQYLSDLNRAYDEKFENLKEYKNKSNFRRILKKLTIDDVISAVERSRAIMDINKENGYKLQQYRGYKFYKENQSLSIWNIIEKILEECNLK